jgi:DNA-binding XRE family transcriptional regulator
MGQIVPKVKAKLSPPFFVVRGYHSRMTTWPDEATFNEAFCARVKRLRIERGWTQAQMAAALDLPFERYKKYETRSPLPHYLVERLALTVDRDPCFVLTGHEHSGSHRPRPIARPVNFQQKSGD